MKKNDYEKMRRQLQEYAQLKAEKAEKDARMKELTVELREFAERNAGLFDTDGKLHVEGGMSLRWADRTVVEKSQKFNLTAFFAKYRHFCDITIPVAGLKKAFGDKETAKELNKLGLSLAVKKDFVIEI